MVKIMADLDGLIRYRKHIVEEKQKIISELYREAERVERQKQTILEQMEKERAVAEAMEGTDALSYLGRYLEGARTKIKVLEHTLEKMEARIMAAQEDMRAAFAEQKKVQIVQRTRQEREETEEKKREDKELDDIAVEGHRRKDDSAS